MSKVKGGQVYVEIGADPRKLFKALTDLNKSIGKIGASMASLGTRMTAIGAAIGAPIGLATRQFAQFDDAIRATAAVSQASGAELQKLNDTARELGATTSFTAVQVANLMTELGRAGFKPDEINAMTGAVLDLARATGTDAALSAGIMAASLRQFGLGATEATRAADVLTKAANSTFNTVESLGEALKYAGPVAKSLGLSLEDTTAILGVLGNVGIQGSEAGTALRRLSVISAASGKELKDLFGITNVDAAGNLKSLVDILDEINTVTANMPVAERTARMAKAFGLLGITSANVLSSSAEGVRGLADSLRNAEGTAAKAAKEMDAGLGGAIRIALSAIEGTALAIGDALNPALIAAIRFVEHFATAVTGFVKDNAAFVNTLAQGAAAAIVAGTVFAGLGLAVQGLSFAFGGVIKAAAMVVIPLATVVSTLISVSVSFGTALASVVAYAAGSVAAATATAAAWGLANVPIVALVGVLVAIAGLVAGIGAGLVDAANSAASAIGTGLVSAGRSAIGVLKELGRIGQETFKGIYESLDAGNMQSALAIGMAGLKAVFSRGASAFMNAVDEWGVNLVNTFDFYISQIPFLRFLGKDTYEFSVFGDSTQSTNANQRADQRGAELFDRQQQRRERDRQSEADLSAVLRDSRLTNTLRGQAKTLEQAIGGASTIKSLSDMADEFRALRDTGKLTVEQIAKLDDALDGAAERITEAGSGRPASGEVARRGGGVDLGGFGEDGLAGAMAGLIGDDPAATGDGIKISRRVSAIEQQAQDVMDRLRNAWDAKQMRDAADEGLAMVTTKAVGREQAAAILEAIQNAQLAVDPGAIAEETRRQGVNQAEAVGTFSSVALGGMGFGNSLQQKIADNTKRTADELAALANGLLAGVAP